MTIAHGSGGCLIDKSTKRLGVDYVDNNDDDVAALTACVLQSSEEWRTSGTAGPDARPRRKGVGSVYQRCFPRR
ncbi:hypothetical protein DK867_21300 [Ochrobactrum sp. POC9]|nr:hypothetical protein DK867_21300 [Ochrobactrum sp. POC9]